MSSLNSVIFGKRLPSEREPYFLSALSQLNPFNVSFCLFHNTLRPRSIQFPKDLSMVMLSAACTDKVLSVHIYTVFCEYAANMHTSVTISVSIRFIVLCYLVMNLNDMPPEVRMMYTPEDGIVIRSVSLSTFARAEHTLRPSGV